MTAVNQFYWLESADGKEKRLAYRCTSCNVMYQLGDGETKIFCCQQWKPVPENPAGFFSGLPTERHQPTRYAGVLTLRHPTIGRNDED
jgi:hypothetical protein